MKTPKEPAVAFIEQLSDAILAISDEKMTKMGEHVKRNVVEISMAALQLASSGSIYKYINKEYALEAIHFTGDLFIAQVVCMEDDGGHSFGAGGTPHEAIMFALADNLTPEPILKPRAVGLN